MEKNGSKLFTLTKNSSQKQQLFSLSKAQHVEKDQLEPNKWPQGPMNKFSDHQLKTLHTQVSPTPGSALKTKQKRRRIMLFQLNNNSKNFFITNRPRPVTRFLPESMLQETQEDVHKVTDIFGCQLHCVN